MALINDYHSRLEKNQIDLCRLHYRTTDLIPFYRKSGYRLFPTREVKIQGRNSGSHDPSFVRNFDRDKDFLTCVDLYNDFNKDYLGSLIWDSSYGNWNNKRRLVWNDGEGVKGYLYGDDCFGQVAFDRDRPEIFMNLIGWILNWTPRFTTKLPQDRIICSILDEMDLDYEYRTVNGEESHNMMKVCNPEKFSAPEELLSCNLSTGGSGQMASHSSSSWKRRS